MNNSYNFLVINYLQDDIYRNKMISSLEESGFTYLFISIDDNGSFSVPYESIKSCKAIFVLLDNYSLKKYSENIYEPLFALTREAESRDCKVYAFLKEDIDFVFMRSIFTVPLCRRLTFVKFNETNFYYVTIDTLKAFSLENRENELYEQLHYFISIEHVAKIVEVIKELVSITINSLPPLSLKIREKEEDKKYLKLANLFILLRDNFICGYSNEERDLAHVVNELVAKTSNAIINVELYKGDGYKDLFRVCLALTFASLFSELLREGVDVITTGDIRLKLRKEDEETKALLEPVYKELIWEYKKKEENRKEYNSQERILIENTAKLDIFAYITHESSRPKKNVEKTDKKVSVDEKTLLEIANHINETNRLFTSLGEDKKSLQYLICLKTSYERLRNYAELIGSKEVCAICTERLSFINSQIESYSGDDLQNDVKEQSFKALLGFSLPSSASYNAFISYKHEDIDLATKIYHYIKSNFINAFFDKVSLPSLGKSEYHDAIMDSLDCSENFVLILSKLEYIQSEWVSLELKTFNKEVAEGRKPNANIIFVVTPDVYDEIISTNKRCLPIQYRGVEIILTTNYRDTLIPYIKNSDEL